MERRGPRRRTRWVATLLVVAGSVSGAALETSRQASRPQTQSQTFRASADTVEVDVSVFDKRGQPVTDLRADEFEIVEDGVRQRLDAVYLATVDRTLLANAAAPATAGGAAPEAPGALPPRRELQQRTFVFVLDMPHLSADGFTRSKAALESFLNDGLTPADFVGVVANGVMLGGKVQRDKRAALGELAGVGMPNLTRYNELRVFPRLLDEEEAIKIARGDERVLDQAVQRGCRERPGECQKAGGDDLVRLTIETKARTIAAEASRDAQRTLTALQTLASGLGRLPGPKQVVLFSEGFFVDEFTEWLRQIVGLAARHNVRFSTIDARGLGRDPRLQNVLGEQPLAGPGDLAVMGFDAGADVLASLALDTGGERVLNRNNLRPALDVIARENSSYYVLGYSTSRPFDGSYRRIEIKVTRPDVTVRARRGYIAARPDAPRDPTAVASTPAMAPPAPAATAPPPAPAGATALPPAAGTTAPGSSTPRPSSDVESPGRPGSAARIDALAKSAAPSTTEADRLARQGWQDYTRGDVESAQARLRAAVDAGAAAPWVHYALGQAEFALQHFDAAIVAWTKVREALPEYEPVYFDLADGFLQLSRTAEALDVLRQAARRWPKDTETHNAAGVVLVRRGALDDAIESFERAVAADPSDGLGYFNLGRAYHLRCLRALRVGSSLAERDRRKALDYYKRYLDIGGPFADDARRAMDLLSWK